MTALDSARALIARGWAVTPVRPRDKAPTLRDWPSRTVSAADAPDLFGADENIGVRLGTPSGDLVDIDLDCDEAVEFAPSILPATAVFGRQSRPRSHWLYKSAVAHRITCEDPNAKVGRTTAMILEIRTTGQQTVFPGSIHPTGEEIQWESDIEPVWIDPAELVARARYLAGVVLIKRYWPPSGARHDAALALIGVLARGSMPPRMIARLVTAANDGESYEKHFKLATDALARSKDGRRVAGIPKLIAAFGERVGPRIIEYLGISRAKPSIDEVRAAVGLLRADSSTRDVEHAVSLLRAAALTPIDENELIALLAKHTGISRRVVLKQLHGPTKRESAPSSRATELVAIGREADLWHDPVTHQRFASVTHEGFTQHLQIGSRAFNEWLAREFYSRHNSVPDDASVSTAVSMLKGIAHIEGEAHKTWLRVAQHEGAIYVDIGDDRWTAVKITGDGWEFTSNPPVRFRRASGQPLPMPERGGAIEDLRPFINATDEDFTLVVAALVNAFRPGYPFPILLITGEKGSAKTTALRFLRLLLDPAAAAGAGLPRYERDLVIAAQNNWLISGDNASRVSGDLADALCRLATGGGLRIRMLYTDAEEFVIEAQRPVFITALSAITEREDFLDRVVLVRLKRIEGNRRTEEDVNAAFQLVRPRILGKLFDGVATALRRLSSISLEDPPRMADFARFATASSPAFGWGDDAVMIAYATMRAAVFEDAALANPLVRVVVDWLQAIPNRPGFEGGPEQLFAALLAYAQENAAHDAFSRSRDWPRTPAVLVRGLSAARTGLTQSGVDLDIDRDIHNRSHIKLRLRNPQWRPFEADDLPF
jgi:hypothetical protein